MDPAEFRILNGAKENDRRPDGLQYARIGHIETVEAILNSEQYQSPLEGKYRGRGIASGYWNNWGGQSSATAVLNPDGTVNLNEASTDIGGSRASIAMQLAEAMDIEYEHVRARVVDTDTVSYNDVTGGSRTTFATGLAAYNLGQQLKGEMKRRLAEHWDVALEDVKLRRQRLQCRRRKPAFRRSRRPRSARRAHDGQFDGASAGLRSWVLHPVRRH